MNLTWGKIDFNQNIITIDETKIGEGRKLWMNRTVKETLIALRLDRPDANYVFGNDTPIGDFKVAWNGASLLYIHSSQGHKKEAVDLLDLHKNPLKSAFKLPQYCHITEKSKR